MTRTRVALVALPELMGDLVRRACQADDEIEVGPLVGSLSEMSTELMRSEVDVAIVGTTSGDDARLALAALASWPRMRVLLIVARNGMADMFALRPQRIALGAVTPADIVKAVRNDNAHAAAWADIDNPLVERGG